MFYIETLILNWPIPLLL